ncbi:hypothetical protein M758_10G085900 [Ceratodon purpureus]|uniref:Uncharacterized protein n=1 Tax=Ceratodon purpureus TaxID=3225 RepID=A0A8T0GLZ8_CERPU|nr:hypothetical protein KC19_10G087000 [Ceratodon purpureus]KAG0559209.1 hypothetical protein KC19_10G087300 [Ceratodon purpureus]KAG0603332.1 hypothetical protein M758_10G085600 [Ceratodon purpureus]KAG0603335.1 hypothetical protein M758_10G085900 [Ceratodon purpureus]
MKGGGQGLQIRWKSRSELSQVSSSGGNIWGTKLCRTLSAQAGTLRDTVLTSATSHRPEDPTSTNHRIGTTFMRSILSVHTERHDLEQKRVTREQGGSRGRSGAPAPALNLPTSERCARP